MVKYGLCGFPSDLQRPVGGHHPMLYFTSQIKMTVRGTMVRSEVCGVGVQDTFKTDYVIVECSLMLTLTFAFFSLILSLSLYTQFDFFVEFGLV